ncbi:MAG: hypothetical protein Q7S40_10935 [Opitutaceae bacterium]|nr:hypothetical protein [Opitutaceae bacterium]
MKNNSRAFVNQFFVGLLVTLCFGGTVGLGTVWMRHQISITAKTNRMLLASIDELERHLAEKIALVESEQSPGNLRHRNEDFRLGLVAMSDPQVAVMPIADDPVRRMVMAANRRRMSDGPEQVALTWREGATREAATREPRTESPARVTFSVAFRR